MKAEQRLPVTRTVLGGVHQSILSIFDCTTWTFGMIGGMCVSGTPQHKWRPTRFRMMVVRTSWCYILRNYDTCPSRRMSYERYDLSMKSSTFLTSGSGFPQATPPGLYVLCHLTKVHLLYCSSGSRGPRILFPASYPSDVVCVNL